MLDQLRKSGAVGESALESALRRQQIYGGSLDTVLLELELVDPKILSDELAAANECESVPVALLEPGLERPWDALPPELAALGWIMPLRRHLGTVQVAIHPEIPSEQRTALERSIDHLQVMVTCEACLAKLAAERSGSVMPQRYAILALRWMQAMRNPSPTTAADVPVRESAAPAPWMSVSAETAPYTVPPVSKPATVRAGGVSANKPSGQRSPTFLYGLPVDDDDEGSPAASGSRARVDENRPAAPLADRLAGPRSALAEAVGRDQATDALARAA
ncbi:MAG: hypothetical protein KC457_31220, partial [Myxococcales bacterium]|nr:hypothetical protein [Myxococcales bacterium]